MTLAIVFTIWDILITRSVSQKAPLVVEFSYCRTEALPFQNRPLEGENYIKDIKFPCSNIAEQGKEFQTILVTIFWNF